MFFYKSKNVPKIFLYLCSNMLRQYTPRKLLLKIVIRFYEKILNHVLRNSFIETYFLIFLIIQPQCRFHTLAVI